MKIVGNIGPDWYNRAELTRADLTQADLTQGRLDPHSYNTRWSDKQSYLTDRYTNSLAKLPKTDKIFWSNPIITVLYS